MDRYLFFYNCQVIKDPSGNFVLNYYILPALGFKTICSDSPIPDQDTRTKWKMSNFIVPLQLPQYKTQ